MALGGKRPGAGRKKGSKATHTVEREKAREYLINRIAEELNPIVTAQLEAAKGMYVEELNDKGERIKVYRKLPNLNTGEYLLDQGAGKATETVDVTSAGKPIPILGNVPTHNRNKKDTSSN